jgi:hypothetical protein
LLSPERSNLRLPASVRPPSGSLYLLISF